MITPVTDIYMDEQTSLEVVVDTINPDNSPRDITDGSIVWVADFNGVQQVRKDTATMTIMPAPQTSAVVEAEADPGQKNVTVNKVWGFGLDAWGREIANFAVGDTVTIIGPTVSEYNTIASIDAATNKLTMTNPLVNIYPALSQVAKIISQFSFTLLPGDTILPATKSYGTQMVWQHMALITFSSQMSPENIYATPTTVVGVRGRLFINPILSME